MKVVIIVALAIAAGAQGQSVPADSIERSGLRTSEFWIGYSNSSPKLGFLGNRPGMSFGIVALRLTDRLQTRRTFAIDYAMELVPYAISSPPLSFGKDGRSFIRVRSGCELDILGCRFRTGSAIGAGLNPLGLSGVFRRDRMLQFRFGGTGGFLWFDRRVPTEISTQFNFTFSVETGAQLIHHSGSGVLLMYRFHHLSNAGTGFDNSALASNLISLGVRWRRRGSEPRSGPR